MTRRKPQTKPEPPVSQPPAEGGSYVRDADGNLIKASDAAPVPADPKED